MKIETLGRLPTDIIGHEICGYIPTKVQLENGEKPIEVRDYPVRFRSKHSIHQRDEIYRYYARDLRSKLYRPSMFLDMDVEMKEGILHVPMTFIEIKRCTERYIYDNPDNNYTRELRFYRVVYCLFSKVKAMEWVRYMNKEVKWRGHVGNFRLKQFKETTVKRDWYGTYKVWRYARRQSWRFIPKANWNDIFKLPPAILSVPIANTEEQLL